MEQCRLCPAKLWSNADFTPRNHRAFVLCPAKSWRLRSLPRKIMEQCRLCSAKLRRHSFRGKQISLNLNFFTFFLIIFVNHCYFRDPYNPLDHFLRKKILCHGTFKPIMKNFFLLLILLVFSLIICFFLLFHICFFQLCFLEKVVNHQKTFNQYKHFWSLKEFILFFRNVCSRFFF